MRSTGPGGCERGENLNTLQCFIFVDPPLWRHAFPDHSRLIVPADNGYFGLAILSERSIKFWERETQLSGAATWLLRRTVRLDRVLAGLELKEKTSPLRVVGFAEENNVIFLSADDCIFMIHVESMQFKKVKIAVSQYIHPYSSF
ncbi:hypothetical protein PR202_ga27861 [Eleusine coracana subsp. coracana]|uniref:F-box protein AT5G49610-like beta-propeller domain-containing protein n=1 Tax=Eleusine coracana subsp. coracana TaxID=191504 RepID=A0AAV5DIQ0_ELECO|nr:hypothetical protein PR202_ga27861 [Eleusine coracana subsp. coracana]